MLYSGLRSIRYTLLALFIGTMLVLDPISNPKQVFPSYPTFTLHKRPIEISQREKILSAKHPRFLLLLSEQADLGQAQSLPTKREKTAFAFHSLSHVAARHQPAVIRQLQNRGCRVQSYTVINGLSVECPDGLEVARRMEQWANDAAIAGIEPDLPGSLNLPAVAEKERESSLSPSSVEWNIQKVHAPEVWALGYLGQNIVIGNQDTGFQWDHPALKGKYRGWNGTSANHNYHWWDAIRDNQILPASSNPCGYKSNVPCDDFGHGTHTMGTAVGDDGQGNQIGVAPGAKWIGCRNMDSGVGRPSTYLECFDFFLAPWDLNKSNPNPALSPDVITNSWGCPSREGCTGESLSQAVTNLRTAGIIVVVAAGNSGPGCSTINEEPAIFDASTTIGATDINDAIAGFSSRGPVTVDSSNRIKPDITAPGASVRSSRPNSTYGPSSGTSMATPHFAGAVAVLLSAYPHLQGRVNETEAMFFHSAIPMTSQQCTAILGSQVPDPVSGWGRLDLMGAIRLAGSSRTFLPLTIQPQTYEMVPTPRSKRLLGTP